jgi:hypothetical protein
LEDFRAIANCVQTIGRLGDALHMDANHMLVSRDLLLDQRYMSECHRGCMRVAWWRVWRRGINLHCANMRREFVSMLFRCDWWVCDSSTCFMRCRWWHRGADWANMHGLHLLSNRRVLSS